MVWVSLVLLPGSWAALRSSPLPVLVVEAAATLKRTSRAAATSVALTGLLMLILMRLRCQLCQRLWVNVALSTGARIFSLVARSYFTRHSVAILRILPYLTAQSFLAWDSAGVALTGNSLFAR